MKFCTWLWFGIAASILASSTSAQTLNEQLIAEDPATLVEDAKQYGNIVRGAILFHQGNINCAKCHRSTSERDRIGPDLSRIGSETSDEMIVESILLPSKVIKEGFEVTITETVDGRVVSGIQVSENEKEIVLRDNQNLDTLITIQREDIDQSRVSEKSNMPENLANELKDRKQFLDLLRYVIDVRARGPEANTGETKERTQRELSLELKGLVLIQKHNCAACHQSDSLQSLVAAKKAPRLKWSGKWLNPDHIESFIADPHAVKPGTTMPELLGQLDDATRKKTAESITHFIASNAGNDFQSQTTDTAATPRGFELFQSVGCAACHSPRDENSVEQPLTDSVPLGDLANKYNVTGLVSFLEDPLVARPSGHMPNMVLTHREAVDISSFLLQSTKESATKWKIDSDLAREGEVLFKEHRCASCHSEMVEAVAFRDESLTLEKLNPEQGCLSAETGDWPNFHLKPADRQAIQTALKQPSFKLDDQQRIDVSLTTFNCIACHDRNDLGGITAERNPHFKTTNLNLGDQGRIPPTLTGVGAKLKSNWMRDVLVNHRSIRPYMKTRMPQYGEENIAHLVQLFEDNDHLSETTFATFKDQKEMRLKGLELAGNKGLNCVACHTYQYKISDTMPAVDLTEMTERLEKDWFYQYMLAPQKFSPNTVMPSLWPGGNAIRKDIEGTPEEQIEALWQYLVDGRQARAPSGVVRERLEIVVTDEAKMLRRSYPEIGKRGIGVGYPRGVNIAFDAEQMRLGMIWKGKFADPGGVWTGQGSGTVRPMSQPINFAKGPELDDAIKPWVVDDGRPPNHHFKGYVLDDRQRPTFSYAFDSVDVKDFFSERIEGAGKPKLRRSVLLSTNEDRDGLRFRIAAAKSVSANDDTFSIDDLLKIRIVSDHNARVVDTDDGKMLEILIQLKAGRDQEIVVEYSWD